MEMRFPVIRQEPGGGGEQILNVTVTVKLQEVASGIVSSLYWQPVWSSGTDLSVGEHAFWVEKHTA